MKIYSAVLFVILLTGIFACEQDVVPEAKNGRVSFHLNDLAAGTGPLTSPVILLLTLETSEGKDVLVDESYSLSLQGDDFVTEESIQLPAGSYHISKLLILAGEQVIYASPRAGSAKAHAITNSLPITFQVLPNHDEQLSPQLLGVLMGDQASDFGYETQDFGTNDIPGEITEWMNVRVKFEPTIGGILYDNTDAEFTVMAYDDSNVEQWRVVLPYTGPGSNDLEIRTGFYRYVLEVKKWGITSQQTFIGTYLWDKRVHDGVVPTTFVFSGSADPKRVKSYISYTSVSGELTPESKVSYLYDQFGEIVNIYTYLYSAETGTFIADTQSDFYYVNNRVSKIETFLAHSETMTEESTYTYDSEGRPTLIRHKSNTSGVTTNVHLTYAALNRKVDALYSFSNGQQFNYSFNMESENMVSDRTTKGSQLCSEGIYTYDRSINPLKHTGYVDFLLRNYSTSNRLTEQVNYIGCAIPELVPESYEYTYDCDGYPTVAVKRYKGTQVESQLHYFYQ